MTRLLTFLLTLGVFLTLQAQENDRELLRGTVLYRNTPVPSENVINTTAGRATITDERGEFAIAVREGDELVFMALNYELQVVTVSAEMLQRNRLVVEVNEKVTQLDEVTVSPEEQQEFLRLQNEDFKQFDYEADETSDFQNIAQDQTVRGMQYGLNFVNLFKLLTGTYKRQNPQEPIALKMSDVLLQIYDEAFFVQDLKIAPDRIGEFLTYCDSQLPPRSLLRKENEFELIDFLVTQSEAFRNTQE